MNSRAGFGAFYGVSKLMSRSESRPKNINERAKGKRTDSGLNPGSFAAYLSDAPKTATWSELIEAYNEGIEPRSLRRHIERNRVDESEQAEFGECSE